MRYRQERRYCFYTVSQWKAVYDSVIHFQGLPLRLAVARTEKELKHCFLVVSRGKAIYNETPVEFIPEGKQRRVVSRWKALFKETPVEFIPGEGKQRRAIPLKRNEMFSVTPSSVQIDMELKYSFQVKGTKARYTDEDEKTFSVTPSSVQSDMELKYSFQVVSRWKALFNGTPVEFIPGEGKQRPAIPEKRNEMFSVTPSSVQTDIELKYSFLVVSGYKALYKGTPVEFILGEGKQRRGIPVKRNEMFSVTPGSILMVSVNQTERETDFIYC
ncbi:hypothetical protein T07_6931 [Trichinella nelsoni]|uniref:Uncharacterized protein n=1 Tax=Trichinella nelsoni TaxID=6336 RepID=A0A0V0REI0_9BILA|nr:hypothetical protein T07_6931 [Trichinella nelsoni]